MHGWWSVHVLIANRAFREIRERGRNYRQTPKALQPMAPLDMSTPIGEWILLGQG